MYVNIEMKGVVICSNVVNRRGGLRDAWLLVVMMPHADLYTQRIPSMEVSTNDNDDSSSTAVLDDDDDLAVE
jgi:hypothetical protein